MLRKVLHSKIHMAAVTAASPDYMGSITIAANLLDACGMRVNDAVTVANCRNGARCETYVFRGKSGSKAIEINGAAALLFEPGDRCIILHFAYADPEEYVRHRPTVLLMNPDNTVQQTLYYDHD